MKEKSFKITGNFLKKYCFKNGDSQLSQKIDKICYAYPNKRTKNNLLKEVKKAREQVKRREIYNEEEILTNLK